MITTQGETDFVWRDESAHNAEKTTLIVFQQNEVGFASFIAGMGLIGSADPVCKIYNKLFQVPSYNTVPEPTFPEWRVYEARNDRGERFFILRMTHTYPLPTAGSGDHAWLYTYPIVRDVIKELSRVGVDELVYLTTNQMQAAVGYEGNAYATLHPKDVVVFDFWLPEDEPMTMSGKIISKDLVMPQPSWMFGEIFTNYVPEAVGCWIVIGYAVREMFIDTQTAGQLLHYFDHTYGLSHDTETMDKIVLLLEDLEQLTDIPTMDRLMNDTWYEGDFSSEWV